MVVDTHCHLNLEQFSNDVADVITRALKNGVKRIIIPGTDITTSERAIALSEQFDACYALIGFHPEDLGGFSEENIEKLEQLTKKHKKVVGIGEIGLDYHWKSFDKATQKKAFSAQALLAKKYDLPISIHARDAELDAFTIVQELEIQKAVFHCYTGPLDIAQRIWDSGHHMSFTACIGYPNNDALRSLVQECPLEQIMVETDAPYMAPQERRGERCEPSDVLSVVETIANVHSITKEEVARITTENAERFFSLTQ